MTTPAQDLARNLKDPEFAKLYGAASAKSEFAILLAQARVQKGLTQRQLGYRMGWATAHHLKALEGGDANPGLGTCGSLLAVMGYRLVMSLAPLEPENDYPFG